MPIGNDPPESKLTETVFDAINDLQYSANDLAFEDQSTSDLYYLFQQEGSGAYASEWALEKTTTTEPNPFGKIPQATADTLLGGTYDSNDNTVSYQSKSYRFRLEWDGANGIPVVAREAV